MNQIKPQPSMKECEKLSEAAEKHNAILEFLDWLSGEKDLLLAERTKEGRHLVPTMLTKEELVFDFLDIDPLQVERERRALLDWMTEQSCSADANRNIKTWELE